jgi:hypothetical protein
MDFFLRGALLGLQILGRLLALPANLLPGWKSLKVRDTVAYESLRWLKKAMVLESMEDIFTKIISNYA